MQICATKYEIELTDNYHNAQVVTVELNIKMQFNTVKTINGSNMVRQHFPSQDDLSPLEGIKLSLLIFYKILFTENT